jgi:hypothetical protein
LVSVGVTDGSGIESVPGTSVDAAAVAAGVDADAVRLTEG